MIHSKQVAQLINNKVWFIKVCKNIVRWSPTSRQKSFIKLLQFILSIVDNLKAMPRILL